jgi:hypothetical protein
MPLRDHFHPPLSLRKSWESLHNAWAVMMASRLNGALLTPEFEAEPTAHRGTQIEIDLATYREEREAPVFGANGNHGGLATELRTYAPPRRH